MVGRTRPCARRRRLCLVGGSVSPEYLFLVRSRRQNTPRRFQRNVVADHFLEVFLQLCLDTQRRIDRLEKATKSVTASPEGRTGEAIRQSTQTGQSVTNHPTAGK